MITKKIGKGEYAYLAVREGKKVVHKYLGPVDSPEVQKKLAEKKETAVVPERFRALFWDTNIDAIHLKRNARYIIERVLEFGELDALEWMQRVYPTQIIIDVLSVSRSISERSRNFWEIWFGVKHA
ncbi:MAG: hypothetical protein K8I29_01725 [Alphaproteobacteria bacterium]|uniref:Uncharacterized protein n=1 Tax=Candidatus Nitrobium versatile TaxID=2884831 RepID=A0A953J287_9BACT|nr:hypothetical protein [Candidatus Nitrobium versatile]